MRPASRRRRTAAAAVALLGVPLSWSAGTAAVADLRATASAGNAVGTATWSAVATTATTAPFGSGPLTLSFIKSGKNTSQYFHVANAGTVGLTAAQYRLTASPALDAVLEACDGTWNQRNGSCSGTIATLTSTAGTTTSAVVPSAPGTVLPVRVRLLAASKETTVVVDVGASSRQLG